MRTSLEPLHNKGREIRALKKILGQREFAFFGNLPEKDREKVANEALRASEKYGDNSAAIVQAIKDELVKYGFREGLGNKNEETVMRGENLPPFTSSIEERTRRF